MVASLLNFPQTEISRIHIFDALNLRIKTDFLRTKSQALNELHSIKKYLFSTFKMLGSEGHSDKAINKSEVITALLNLLVKKLSNNVVVMLFE